MLVPRKSKWEKFCNSILEIKNFATNNKTKAIGSAIVGGGVTCGVNLGLHCLNEKNKKPYLKWFAENKKTTTIISVTAGGFLGFGAAAMMYGEKSELLKEINNLKKLIKKAEEKKTKLNERDIEAISDIEKIILENNKIKQDGVIEGLTEALAELENRLKDY